MFGERPFAFEVEYTWASEQSGSNPSWVEYLDQFQNFEDAFQIEDLLPSLRQASLQREVLLLPSFPFSCSENSII